MTDSMPPSQFVPLPTPLTSFVGRERDIDHLASLLQHPDVRLVTLTGPGGVGKTRLALAVATTLRPDFVDGIAFVGLAPVRDPTLVASAIAHALSVAASGDEPPEAAILAALRRAPMLLVLDNFEHVLEAALLVTTLLTACPDLTVLVTSRAALHVSGEREYTLSPLALPAADLALPEHIAQSPAVRLFVERALAVDPDFQLTDNNTATIAAICQRLDGLPLAIELAAARSKVLSPNLLLPRLSASLPLLTGGPRDVPARLQTMQDAITWSHELLTPPEQVLFRRLGVFVGGFTLEAAERVCGSLSGALALPDTPGASVLDGIASLVDKSLLQWGGGQGRDRLSMLETIREFALEQLEAVGEAETARTAHAAYFAALDEQLHPNRLAPGEQFDDRLVRIDAELPNVRAALTQLARTDHADGVLRLAGTLAVFWQVRAHLQEGRGWLEWALARTDETPTVSRGLALVGLALLCWAQSDYAQTAALANAALATADHDRDRYIVAFALNMLGLVAEAQQQWLEAASRLDQALGLWRELGATSEEAMTLHLLGDVAYGLGDRDQAARYSNASLTRFRAIGYASGAALALCQLAVLARDAHQVSRAAVTYREALQLWVGVRDRWLLVLALAGLAELASTHGEASAGATLLGSVEALATATAAPLFHTAPSNAERTRVACMATLGKDQFAERYAAGQRLPRGETIALAIAVANRLAQQTTPPRPGARAGVDHLTAREQDILRLLAASRTDQEIADALFLSRRTVNGHVGRILAKLEVPTRREAVARGRALGLLAEGDTPLRHT